MIKLFFLFLSLSFAVVYFVPAFVAITRKHANVLQITLLNAFLGWVFPVWVASLIWATTKNTDDFVETKGAWITVAVFFLLMSMPILFTSIVPTKYKTHFDKTFHYKKVIYITDIDPDTGKVMRKVVEIKK